MSIAVLPPSRAAAPLFALMGRYDSSSFDVPSGRHRVRLIVSDADEQWDAVLDDKGGLELRPARLDRAADASLTADRTTWRIIAADLRSALTAYAAGRLRLRRNLHLALGLLAATSGETSPARLRSLCVETRRGRLSTLQAGDGEPVVMLHGLGATKAEFLPTIASLAPGHRTIAVDMPGFGDSAKPVAAAYDANYFAGAVVALLDALNIESAHVIGHSLGGRVALEAGLRHPDRVRTLSLWMPALAWRRSRPWAPWLRLVRPELGLLHPAPRGIVEAVIRQLLPEAQDGWFAVGVEEFLRSYCDARGRAAFYAAARNIYLDQPHGARGLWTRLPDLEPPAMFVWGRGDFLVPATFARHVREALPDALHVELACGHVPQVVCPDQLHGRQRDFLRRHRGTLPGGASRRQRARGTSAASA